MPPKFIALTLNKLQPHAARNWFKTIKHLMQYAVSVELVRIDPTRDIKLPKASSKEHRPWTDAEIAAYEAKHPIGSKARLAFALGYYTAQAAATWSVWAASMSLVTSFGWCKTRQEPR
jgi:hypothetical protein